MQRLVLVALAVFGFGGCGGSAPAVAPPAVDDQTLPEGAEVMSLLGKPLYAPRIDTDNKTKLKLDLLRARNELEAHPDDGAKIAAVAQSLMELYRYRDAMQLLTEALTQHGSDSRLRHELGLCRFALRDFPGAQREWLAAWMSPPEGMAPAEGDYLGGLAFLFTGDLAGAREAMAQVTQRAGNERKVEGAFWLRWVLWRQGAVTGWPEVAAQVKGLAAKTPFVAALAILDGSMSAKQAETRIASMSKSDGMVLRLALAQAAFEKKDADAAKKHLELVVESVEWASPIYIAAEVELAGLGKKDRAKSP